MFKIIKKYPVICSLLLICLIFALLTTINNSMYDLFAFHSKPKYFWQYFSGTFMHGIKGESNILLWIHFLLNFLFLIIPFGILLEDRIGSKKILFLVLFTIIISSITFHLLMYGKDELATGISIIGYSFFTGGLFIIIKSWNKYSKKKKALYILLILMALIILMPTTLGWTTSIMHFSGVISYLLFYLLLKCFKVKI